MKYAFMTGAAGGLGGACTRALVSTGDWVVFAADINDIALAEIGKVHNVIPIKVDITNQDSVENAFEEVKKTTDKLDALINFAGINVLCSLVEDDAIVSCDKSIQINLMSMIRINKVFFPFVKNANGRIINCSSECGLFKAQPFNGPYSLSKYGVEAYSDSLRKELMFQGIKVVKLEPGSFKTKMHGQATSSFDRLYQNTKYYKGSLKRMKPMMDIELKMANDPKYLVEAFMEAVTSEKPKRGYRIKNSKLLGFCEYVPDAALEVAYRLLLKNN